MSDLTPESLVDSQALANSSTPESAIAHGLDPRTPENTTIALCGADWNPTSSVGGSPLLCASCIKIAIDEGLTEPYSPS